MADKETQTPAEETPVAPAVPEVAAPETLQPAEAVVKGKTPVCPHCGSKLLVYVGENLHKLGTAFCDACGLRHRLP